MNTPDPTGLPQPETPTADAPATNVTEIGSDPTEPQISVEDGVTEQPPVETDFVPLLDPDVAPGESEAAPEPQATPDPLEPLAEALDELRRQLAEHQRLLDRQIEVAANLHSENQALRAGEVRQAQQGLVSSVLRVFDDLRHMAATASDPAGQRDLGLAADALADALERNGVEVRGVSPGEAFDPKVHKIASVRSTPDPEANRTVAEVVRPGFAWTDGAIVRVAEVVVFKHDAAAADGVPD